MNTVILIATLGVVAATILFLYSRMKKRAPALHNNDGIMRDMVLFADVNKFQMYQSGGILSLEQGYLALCDKDGINVFRTPVTQTHITYASRSLEIQYGQNKYNIKLDGVQRFNASGITQRYNQWASMIHMQGGPDFLETPTINKFFSPNIDLIITIISISSLIIPLLMLLFMLLTR